MKKVKILILLFACAFVASAQTTPPRSTYAIPGVSSTVQTLLNTTQPYKKRVTAVTQSSTTAPVDTAVENNMPATPTWRYVSTGLYNYRCTACFGSAAKKFAAFVSHTTLNANIRALWLSSDSISITTTDTTGAVKNGLLTNTMVEFRTYP